MNFLKKSKLVKVIIVIFIIVCIFKVKGAISNFSTARQTYTWPDNELTSLISKPDSKYGEIQYDNEDLFEINVYKVSSDEFENYVDDCKDKGFTVDYETTNYDDTITYSAYNKKGYSLYLKYYEKNGYEMKKTMTIELRTPVEEVKEDTSETTTKKSSSKKSSSSSNNSSIDPDFKAAMDSYEDFFDEYVDFMNTYDESDDSLTLLSEYNEYMEQYTETMEKLDAVDEDELNDAELAYYLKVTNRINEKLLTIGE